MNVELIYKVRNSEEELTNLLSKYEKINGKYIRYFDDSLKDMYDHNFFVPLTNIDKDFLNDVVVAKEQSGQGHIKIHLEEREQFLLDNGFEEEILLTMVNESTKIPSKNINLVFKNLSEEDISDDLLDIEMLLYGKEYGEDFTKRKMLRYFAEVRNNNGLDFVAAFLNGKIVASCYIYVNNDTVGLDGLLTHMDYRHQGIATSLLAFVQNKYQRPIYLHADEDDTPKEMYKALGFVEIYKSFDYLKVDKKV